MVCSFFIEIHCSVTTQLVRPAKSFPIHSLVLHHVSLPHSTNAESFRVISTFTVILSQGVTSQPADDVKCDVMLTSNAGWELNIIQSQQSQGWASSGTRALNKDGMRQSRVKIMVQRWKPCQQRKICFLRPVNRLVSWTVSPLEPNLTDPDNAITTLGSRFRIPLVAWMFVRVFLHRPDRSLAMA